MAPESGFIYVMAIYAASPFTLKKHVLIIVF